MGTYDQGEVSVMSIHMMNLWCYIFWQWSCKSKVRILSLASCIKCTSLLNTRFMTTRTQREPYDTSQVAWGDGCPLSVGQSYYQEGHKQRYFGLNPTKDPKPKITNDRFWYKNRPNPKSYANVRARTARPCSEQNMTPGTRHTCDYVWWVAWTIACFAGAIWPWRCPLIEKRSTRKLFVSSKRVNMLLGAFSSEVIYCLKSDPQGAARL